MRHAMALSRLGFLGPPRLVIAAFLVAAFVLFTCVPLAAAQSPAATADAVKVASPPALTADDLDLLANGERFIGDAERVIQTATAEYKAAQANADKAQMIMLATKFKILAHHKLSPDEYAVDAVPRDPNDPQKGREWRIVPIPKRPPAPAVTKNE